MPDLVSWFCANPDRYRTKGAEIIRFGRQWFLRWGERQARGPFSSLDAAMDAWAVIKKDAGT